MSERKQLWWKYERKNQPIHRYRWMRRIVIAWYENKLNKNYNEKFILIFVDFIFVATIHFVSDLLAARSTWVNTNILIVSVYSFLFLLSYLFFFAFVSASGVEPWNSLAISPSAQDDAAPYGQTNNLFHKIPLSLSPIKFRDRKTEIEVILGYAVFIVPHPSDITFQWFYFL